MSRSASPELNALLSSSHPLKDFPATCAAYSMLACAIITVSRRKLITCENTDLHQSNAANIQEAVAANPSESTTTTSTQPQPETRSNMVEEGISGLSPSSSEITLPAEPPAIPAASSQSHAKPC